MKIITKRPVIHSSRSKRPFVPSSKKVPSSGSALCARSLADPYEDQGEYQCEDDESHPTDNPVDSFRFFFIHTLLSFSYDTICIRLTKSLQK